MNETDARSSSGEMRGQALREQMLQQQIIERGIRDTRLIEAMRLVPRELFAPQLSIESAYADHAAAIGHEQTISQPYMVALMSTRLDVRPESKVLEIGTGTGYQTAILARLAREVYTVERIKPLLDLAWDRLMHLRLRNVHFRYTDGTLGWPEAAPFDRVLITAGAPRVPRDLLLGALSDGGQAVLPVGDIEEQILIHARRRKDDLQITNICPCRFVKLIGREGWPDVEPA